MGVSRSVRRLILPLFSGSIIILILKVLIIQNDKIEDIKKNVTVSSRIHSKPERLIPSKPEHLIPSKLEKLIPPKLENLIPPKLENTIPSQLEKFDICIIGAGLSGAVIAERYAATTNKSIVVMDQRDHIGGNCYDYIDDETKIRVSKYGAHLFHTAHDHVWEYLQQFSKWVPYEHKVKALVNGKYVPVPVNIDTVNILFDLDIRTTQEMDSWLKNEQIHYGRKALTAEELVLSRVGQRLYELMFKPYTIKQWNKMPSQLGPRTVSTIPVRNNWDGRYFSDHHQALPKDGYTAIFNKMLKSKQITVRLNTDYFNVRRSLKCGKTYYTGPIDSYYSQKGLEKLEYRSLSFERKVVKNVDHFQPGAVVNHPSAKDNFTRIVEYKWLPNQQYQSNDTVVFIERSTDEGEPYYPVPNKRNIDLYNRYKSFAESDPDIHFVGRLANYKYFNMDQAIRNALEIFDQTKSL